MERAFFRLANHFYLDIVPTVPDEHLTLSGSLNVPKVDDVVVFSAGNVTFFDRVFEVASLEQQRQFYVDDPNQISKNTVSFIQELRPNTNQRMLVPVFDFSALTFIESEIVQESNGVVTPNQSIVAKKVDHRAVMVAFKGPITALEESIHFNEYDIENPLAKQLRPELIQRYSLALKDDMDVGQTQEGLRLLLPQFLDRPAEADFSKFGQNQVNNYFRNQIRPYEKRLAKQIGLYDLRVDYNLGKQLIEDDVSDESNLVGLNIVTNVFRDKVFLRVKTDVDVSSQASEDNRGLRFTEFELTYYVFSDLTVNLFNINEYTDIPQYDPRFSLSYSHEF